MLLFLLSFLSYNGTLGASVKAILKVTKEVR